MDKIRMKNIIDEENGEGYSSNIPTKRTIYKNDSFVCFHFDNIEINDAIRKVVIIDYIHYENKKDLVSILALATNFWMGNKVCFVYFEEKEKKTSKAISKVLQELGMTIHIDRYKNHKYKYGFDCKWDDSNPCTCRIIEANI